MWHNVNKECFMDNTIKKVFIFSVLAAFVAGGAFAQRTAGARYEPNPVSDFKFTASSSSVTITGYQGTDNRVVIPTTIGGKPVTAIGANAFKDNTLITELMIFDGITTIGNNAFRDSSLRWININECTTIGSIGTGAFQGTCLQDMISSWPADKVKKIPNNAFRDSDLNKALVIPDGVTEIGNYAFAGTQITSVILPRTVTRIGANAFSGCAQLTSVTIPSSVTRITFGRSSFSQTALNDASRKALTDRGARL
jgi:hypothetical protein